MDLKTVILSQTYFDHASFTPMFQSVKNVLIEKMDMPFQEERPLYASDVFLAKEVEMALKTIKLFFSADEKDFVLISPSIKDSLQTIYQLHLEKVVKETGKSHILYLDFDIEEIVLGLKSLEKSGCTLEKIPVNKSGQIDIVELKKKINPKTSLITLSWADPLIGVLQPLEEIYQICQEKGIDLHLDTTQVMGKVYLRTQDLPITYMTYNPGKVGGPNLLGVSLIKYQPILKNLGTQIFTSGKDFGKLLAFSMFCYEMTQLTDEFFFDMPDMKEEFENLLQEKIPGIEIVFSNVERLQSHTVVYFPGVHQEMLFFLLKEKGIYTSIGSTGDYSLFSKLMKFNQKNIKAQSCLVFSFSFKTNKSSLIHSVEAIKNSYEHALKFFNSGTAND